MVSKCANPACSEQFRYLHLGKLFQLSPIPEIEKSEYGFNPVLYERFWLCDRCAREMTIVWLGTGARVVPLANKQSTAALVETEEIPRRTRRRRAASAGVDNG